MPVREQIREISSQLPDQKPPGVGGQVTGGGGSCRSKWRQAPNTGLPLTGPSRGLGSAGQKVQGSALVAARAGGA